VAGGIDILAAAIARAIDYWLLITDQGARGAEEKKRKKRRTYLPTFFEIF
jgi:hypothetical protein